MICPASVYWEEYREVNTRSSKDRYQDEACYHCVQKKNCLKTTQFINIWMGIYIFLRSVSCKIQSLITSSALY